MIVDEVSYVKLKEDWTKLRNKLIEIEYRIQIINREIMEINKIFE
jgi:hypothetical protein